MAIVLHIGHPYRDRVLADGAVGYWRLGDAVGSGTAADSSGLGRTGTVAGGVTFGQAGAVDDGDTAALFASGYITATIAALNTLFSIEVWAKFTSTDFVTITEAGPPQFFCSGGRVNLWMTGVSCTSATASNDGAWHHVVATYDGADMRVYVDGVLRGGPTAATGSMTGTTWNIGRHFGGAYYFPGSLDEVAIYPTALSAATVAAHYALALASTKYDDGTLHITELINGRSRLVVDVTSQDGSVRPAKRTQVIATEDGTRTFGGTIETPRESGFGGVGLQPITTTVDAVDFNGLADRLPINAVLAVGNLKAALQAVAAQLAPLGVTLDPAQANGPTLPAIEWRWKQASECLWGDGGLSQLSGYTIEIDYYKVLRGFAPGTVAAPFNIADGDGHVEGDITVEPTDQDYANRVVLLCGKGDPIPRSRFWYGSDAVTVGAYQVFYCDYPSPASPIPDYVKYDATGSGGDIWIGVGVLGDGSEWQWDAAGATTGSNGRACLLHTTSFGSIASAAHVTIDYQGSFPFPVFAETAEYATDPYVYTTANEDITDIAGGQALCDALLVTHNASQKHVGYSTYEKGLHPGQTQTIQAAWRNLNNTFLITEVETEDRGSRSLRTVKTEEGTVFHGDERDTVRGWSGSSSSSGAASGMAVIVRTAYYLGGTGFEAVQSATPTWVAACAIEVSVDATARGTLAATVTVRLRAASAAVSVKARLYNVSDSAACVGESALVTSTTWQTVVFGVTLAGGRKTYRLELLPGVAAEDVFAAGGILE